jgi:hypothetical protein
MEKKKSEIVPPEKPKTPAAVVDVLLLQYLSKI